MTDTDHPDASAIRAVDEQALVFDCQGDALVGILHRPARPRRRGIVVVVGGGPQYRAGGHRQLTLWARALSADGFPVLRFDYRGMGDAHGEFRGFLDVDDDIRAAVDALQQTEPDVDEVVLWGECDAASAILMYAHRDPRVRGAVLLNPWVRTEAGAAQAVLRFYYLQRVMQPSFWKKLVSGRLDIMGSLRSAWQLWQQSRADEGRTVKPEVAVSLGAAISRNQPLPDAMLSGLQRFAGPVMLVMSGRDLIAREFDVLLKASASWQQALASRAVTRHDMADGDHTFSSALQRNQVLAWGRDWLESW